jgi:hypothetical protein
MNQLTKRQSFIDRHLTAEDRLSEILFGLIMVFGFIATTSSTFEAAMSIKSPHLVEARIVQNIQPMIDVVHNSSVKRKTVPGNEEKTKTVIQHRDASVRTGCGPRHDENFDSIIHRRYVTSLPCS